MVFADWGCCRLDLVFLEILQRLSGLEPNGLLLPIIIQRYCAAATSVDYLASIRVGHLKAFNVGVAVVAAGRDVLATRGICKIARFEIRKLDLILPM